MDRSCARHLRHRRGRRRDPRRRARGARVRNASRRCCGERRPDCSRNPSGRTGAMTYCLAMRLDDGLLFLADTRTNAGVDNVGHLPQAPRAASGDRTACSCSSRPATWRRRKRCSTGSTVISRHRGARAWPPSTTSSRPPSTSAGSAARSPPSTSRPSSVSAPTAPPPSSSVARSASERARHPARVPGGQLHPGVRRPAVPADRREQVRQVHARARGRGPRRPLAGHEDRARLDDEHDPRQPRRWDRPTTSPSADGRRARAPGVPGRPRTRPCWPACGRCGSAT